MGFWPRGHPVLAGCIGNAVGRHCALAVHKLARRHNIEFWPCREIERDGLSICSNSRLVASQRVPDGLEDGRRFPILNVLRIMRRNDYVNVGVLSEGSEARYRT